MTHLARLLTLPCAIVLLAACGSAQASPPAQTTAASYVTLDQDLKRLQDDFNANADKVRLVYIVGATCPECLRGMDDLGSALAAERNDPRLRTLVVYVPALGAKATDIQPTVSLLLGNYVSRYWDPSGASGRLFEQTLGTSGFAWDVWMVYGAGRRWEGTKPPTPDFWMEQLGAPLPDWRFLDAKTFSEQVEGYLVHAKPASSGSSAAAP